MRPADEATDEDFDQSREIFAGIVARYYGDSDFRARLDADPTRVLREEGLEIPDGVVVKLLFNTDEVLNIVLPRVGDKPARKPGR